MTKKIFSSKYNEMLYNKEHGLLEHVWLPATEGMTEEEFKEAFVVDPILFQGGKVTLSLIDARDLNFVVTPEVQDWLASTVVKQAMEAGLQRVAYILPEKDFFAQVAVEQSIEENQQTAQLNTRYFSNREEALDWLISG